MHGYHVTTHYHVSDGENYRHGASPGSKPYDHRGESNNMVVTHGIPSSSSSGRVPPGSKPDDNRGELTYKVITHGRSPIDPSKNKGYKGAVAYRAIMDPYKNEKVFGHDSSTGGEPSYRSITDDRYSIDQSKNDKGYNTSTLGQRVRYNTKGCISSQTTVPMSHQEKSPEPRPGCAADLERRFSIEVPNDDRQRSLDNLPAQSLVDGSRNNNKNNALSSPLTQSARHHELNNKSPENFKNNDTIRSAPNTNRYDNNVQQSFIQAARPLPIDRHKVMLNSNEANVPILSLKDS